MTSLRLLNAEGVDYFINKSNRALPFKGIYYILVAAVVKKRRRSHYLKKKSSYLIILNCLFSIEDEYAFFFFN